MSAFYLANIYQILADSNGSQVIIPPTLPNPSTPFSPPTSAVWVNSLWFLSLLISLTCALLATLLQQWARRYMKVTQTQTRYRLYQRVQIRQFFAEGLVKLHLPLAVEALPALLHLSLFLFFAGLAVFLFNINHTVFNVAISWVGFCTGMYVCITSMPIFRHDSPYYAPLSSSAWYLLTGGRFVLFRLLWSIASRCDLRNPHRRSSRIFQWIYWLPNLRSMERTLEATALNAVSGIDEYALMLTYESLDEDHELEQFFAGIPGFCSSKVVRDPQSSLEFLRRWRLSSGLGGFLERTWSSNLISESIKIRRLVICVRAIDAAHISNGAHEVLHEFFRHRPALFQSVELGHSLISWSNNDDRKTAFFAQGIIACIIANVPQRNERWFSLTMHHLGIPEPVLRSYLDHGDSVLHANLIHTTRQFVQNFFKASWDSFPVSLFGLLQSNYNVRDTLPELQHGFCRLWNEIVEKRRYKEHVVLSGILRNLYPIYLALHGGPAEITQYGLCSTPSHLIDSTSNSNEVGGGKTAETARALVTTSPALHHRHVVPSAIPPVTEGSYHAPPSPMSNLDYDHAIPHVVDEQSRNGLLDNISPVASSPHPAPLENDRISDGTAADPIQGTTDPSAISSMADAGVRSMSSHGIGSRPTRNMTIATSSFVPDTVPSPIPLLTVSPDPATRHVSADPTLNESGGPPDDGLRSHSSSQTFTPCPLAPEVISGFDLNAAATGIGPLDAPDDTLYPNRRVMSQSFTRSSPHVAGSGLRPEDGDPSETSGPSQ